MWEEVQRQSCKTLIRATDLCPFNVTLRSFFFSSFSAIAISARQTFTGRPLWIGECHICAGLKRTVVNRGHQLRNQQRQKQQEQKTKWRRWRRSGTSGAIATTSCTDVCTASKDPFLLKLNNEQSKALCLQRVNMKKSERNKTTC